MIYTYSNYPFNFFKITNKYNFRNELTSAQARLSETAATIRSIEVMHEQDINKARKMKKEHEILAQQTKMKQQKGTYLS
jgi:hypothetical protein